MKLIFFLLPCMLMNKNYFISSISCMMFFLTNFLMFNLIYPSMFMFLFLVIMYMYIMKPYSQLNSLFYSSTMMIFLMKLTCLFCLMFFISSNLIYMFLFFELSIIPMFFMLLVYGMTERKIIASSFLLIYTMIFSMIFLAIMMIILKNLELMNMKMLNMMNFNKFLSISLSLMFLVKIPLFFIHIWLPKAHLESSNMGSMLLAGIMLKLGSYGLLLFFNFYCSFKMEMNYFVMIYMIYIYIICLTCIDLKLMVAFFSIAHMAIIISSILLMMSLSFKTVIMMMISHTISSSALFYMISLFYLSFSSRILLNSSSMIHFGGLMIWMFYFFLCLNMSIPPSLNFFSELYFISLIINLSLFTFFLVSLMVLLSGVVSVLIMMKSIFMKEKSFMYFYSLDVSFILVIKTFFVMSLYSIFMLSHL